jgi:RHS repeat-associated protein
VTYEGSNNEVSPDRQISGTNYYFTRDHLGSIREMVDSSGTIQARYSYDPYGRMTQISGSLSADFGYAGMYYHAPSGLNLTFYRAYDSDLGRWLNRDPIGELGGLNLYSYVFNNPINWSDPYGLFGPAGAL